MPHQSYSWLKARVPPASDYQSACHAAGKPLTDVSARVPLRLPPKLAAPIVAQANSVAELATSGKEAICNQFHWPDFVNQGE